jgi:hypothetical protein
MRGFSNRRAVPRKVAWSLAAVLAAAAVGTASLATADVGTSPDNGPPGGPGNPKVTTCGPSQTSTVRTQNAPTTTRATAWATLPGASTQVNVPMGQTRCVKVLFTGETACTPNAGVPDFCYIRALADGVEMDPQGGGFQVLDSEDPGAGARAYEWVGRLGPGNHVITIEWRVFNPATIYWLDDWTFDVEVYA